MAYKINDKMVFRGGFGITTVDLFTAGLSQNFEEYFTSVTLSRPSGDPRPAFFISQGPGQIQYNILPMARRRSWARITPTATPRGTIRTCAILTP